jgi:hypothetical protein
MESVMPLDTEKDIYAVKADAKKQFGWIPGVLGVGIGLNSLRIYVNDFQVQARLPESFEGVQLDCIVTEEITPA